MNAVLVTSSLVFPLVTYPYVSRVLAPEGLGQATFAVSVVSYFIMLAMLGIPTYGIRACAQVRDDREKLSQTVQELMIVNVVMAAFCYLLLGLAILLIGRFREVRLLLWVSSTGILLNAVGVNWFYSAIEEYTYITVRSVAFKLLAAVMMFLFVRSPDDVLWYAAATLVASYGSYVLNFFRLRRYVTFRRFERYSFLPHIRVSLIFFAMSVAATVYTNLDVVMLGFMRGSAEVAYYNTAVKVKTILVSLVTSLGTVLLPRLSYYIQKDAREEFMRLLGRALRFVLYAAVPLTVFFILFAPETVLVLSGDQYGASILPMRIIMPTVLLIGVTNLLGMQIMVPMGQEKRVTVSVAVGGAVDLVLNLILIPPLGAAGAALGTLAAETAVLIVQAVMTRDILRRLPRPSVWRLLCATGAGTAAALAVRRLAQIPWLLVMLATEAAAFGAVFFALLLLLREPMLCEELQRLRGRRRR